MIDLQQFRIRVGYFNRRSVVRIKNSIRGLYRNKCDSNDLFYTILFSFSYLLYSMYSFCITLAFLVDILSSPQVAVSNYNNEFTIHIPNPLHSTNLWILYSGSVFTIFLSMLVRHKINRARISNLAIRIILFISIVRLSLIVISNSSILNPGPNGLSVYFQNVQGLIPFSELGEKVP